MSTVSVNTNGDVQVLLNQLEEDHGTSLLSDAKRGAILSQLKVYGRNPQGAVALYTDRGLQILGKYAFGDYASFVSYEALRCTANALLLEPSLRTIFVQHGYQIRMTETLKQATNDAEFLGSRILFLLTYDNHVNFVELIRSHQLLDSVGNHLSRHASQAPDPQNPMEEMATVETLKFVFNITNKHALECQPLTQTVPSMFTILQRSPVPTPPLDGLVGYAINALAIVEFDKGQASGSLMNAEAVRKLTNILDKAVAQYEAVKLDTQGVPLITVLRKTYDCASPEIQLHMRRALLPDDSERDLPLGQSASLSSRLLRLTTAAGLTTLPEAISSLMFEMSDRNATTFIKNIGYGYAAGYLMSHEIPVPEQATAPTGGASNDRIPVNPVTGQRLDREIVPDLPDMTQEEQEQEAERLFVLFERLKATGVVDVENPVRRAMEEGKIQELDDSDDE